MNKKLSWLSGLLALQLVVAGGLFVGTRSESTAPQAQPLLSFQADQVDRILVSDGKKQVALVRDGGRWHLPDLQALPVDGMKLDSALKQLGELKTTWPVTTSKSSHSRLEVADDKFNRKISLYAGDKLLDEVILGTSPGFKQVYLRPANDDHVYALALNAYEFPVNAFDWLDKGLLEVKNAQRIQEKDLKLVKSGSEWKLDEANSNADDMASTITASNTGNSADNNTEAIAAQSSASLKLDSSKVAQIIDVLGNIQVTAVAEKAPDFSSPDAISIAVAGDADHTFHLVKSDGKYYVKRDDIDAVFTIGQQAFNTLSAIGRKDLLASNGGDTPAAENSGEAPAGNPVPSTAGG